MTNDAVPPMPPRKTLEFFDLKLDLFTTSLELLGDEEVAALADDEIDTMVQGAVHSANIEAKKLEIPWVEYRQPEGLSRALHLICHWTRESKQVEAIIDRVLDEVMKNRTALLAKNPHRDVIAEYYANKARRMALVQGLHWDKDRTKCVKMGVVVQLTWRQM